MPLPNRPEMKIPAGLDVSLQALVSPMIGTGKDYLPRREDVWTGREVNSGRPIRLTLPGVGELPSDFWRSSVDVSWSSEETTIYCGPAFDGVISLVVPEKGNGCNEHTSLASTATARNTAQNSCAPKSRDPCIVFACDRKSSLDRNISASDRMESLFLVSRLSVKLHQFLREHTILFLS